MQNKMNREIWKKRFDHAREVKREREESKRWEQFLVLRAEFDEALEQEMDAYEYMMRNERA